MRSLVFALLVHHFASAAPANLVKVQPANADCSALRGAISHMVTAAGDESEVIAGRKSASIAMLSSIRAPADQDVKAVVPALKANLESNFIHYREIINSDCAVERATISIAMLTTAAKPRTQPEDKKQLVDEVKHDVNSNIYPTYAGSYAIARVIDLGAKKGLWKMSDEDNKALTQTLTELKNKDTEITPKLTQMAKSVADLDTEHLRTNKKFEAVKKLFLNEAVECEKYNTDLRAIAARLQ